MASSLFLKAVPFFKGLNWTRVLLVGGLAVSIFFMGAFWSDKKHAEREAQFEQAKAVAIAERERELNAEFELRLQEEGQARLALANDLELLRDRETDLLRQLQSMNLTVRPADVIIEECVETTDDTTLVIANPFGPDFSRLWNNGSSGSLGDPGET